MGDQLKDLAVKETALKNWQQKHTSENMENFESLQSEFHKKLNKL